MCAPLFSTFFWNIFHSNIRLSSYAQDAKRNLCYVFLYVVIIFVQFQPKLEYIDEIAVKLPTIKMLFN
jgi:hypothetical protein